VVIVLLSQKISQTKVLSQVNSKCRNQNFRNQAKERRTCEERAILGRREPAGRLQGSCRETAGKLQGD
jgi:hypothetical protein